MICFLDTETLGLDPDRHAVWEVAGILYDPVARGVTDRRTWQIQLALHELREAEPKALEITRFHERYEIEAADGLWERETFVHDFAEWLPSGAHLAGAVVSFDEERLRRMLHRYGVAHPWHYHLLDVEGMALGYLHGRYRGSRAWTLAELPAVATALPWKSDDITEALGLPIIRGDVRHTAMGDAQWALDIYERITR